MSNFLEDHARSSVDRKAKFAANCGKVSSISPVVWLALCPFLCFDFQTTVGLWQKTVWKNPFKQTMILKVNAKVFVNVNTWVQLIRKLILLKLNCFCKIQIQQETNLAFPTGNSRSYRNDLQSMNMLCFHTPLPSWLCSVAISASPGLASFGMAEEWS